MSKVSYDYMLELSPVSWIFAQNFHSRNHAKCGRRSLEKNSFGTWFHFYRQPSSVSGWKSNEKRTWYYLETNGSFGEKFK